MSTPRTYPTATCSQCGRTLHHIAGRWSDTDRIGATGRAFDVDTICPAPGEFLHQPTPTTPTSTTSPEGGTR